MTWKDKRYIAANTHRVEECKSNHVPYDDRSALYAPNLFLIGSFREVMHTYYWFKWSIVIMENQNKFPAAVVPMSQPVEGPGSDECKCTHHSPAQHSHSP